MTTMRVVILAGGLGSRLSEETVLRPKPMVEIGGRPILWHIMKIYAHWGFSDFVICLGYKGHMIKDYFVNYALQSASITVDLKTNGVTWHDSGHEEWRVSLVETGESSMTGGRIGRVAPFLPAGEPFCLTYGDGVADIDINALVEFHRRSAREATLTAVRPPARFGAVELDDGQVMRFAEKPRSEAGWINGGFFVCEHRVLSRIAGDDTVWEREPLEGLARDGQLSAFRHDGFWQPMDTLREKNALEEFWRSGRAPWKLWA
jgi:glucose-1-phosphate cytidylyltransferase